MLKTLLIIFLVLYLAIKIAGWAVRFFLRSAGFTTTRNPLEGFSPKEPSVGHAPKQRQAKTTKRPTDTLGEYIDFEEVK